MPLSGHGRAGCCPVFTGCRYSLIRDRIVCKTNYDNQVGSAHHVRISSYLLNIRKQSHLSPLVTIPFSAMRCSRKGFLLSR